MVGLSLSLLTCRRVLYLEPTLCRKEPQGVSC